MKNTPSYGFFGIRNVLLLCALMAAPIVCAAVTTIEVDTVDDLVDDNIGDFRCHTIANTCSLRAAIMQANQLNFLPGVTRIVVPAGIYTLSLLPSGANGDGSGDLNITAPGPRSRWSRTIAISGAGADNTIIDANQIDGVLTVHPHGNATIAGVTLRGGIRQTGMLGGDDGGGVKNFGRLAIADSVIENNSNNYWGQGDGGGVHNVGAMTIASSVIRNNRGLFGGGVSNNGRLTITGSTVENNFAVQGGGIGSSGAALSVVRSSIRGNQASDGGGMFVSEYTKVRDSTVSNNFATSSGGGIFLYSTHGYSTYGDFSRFANSTISSNFANGDGGGILLSTGTAALYNCTVVGNDADHDRDEYGGNGGGVFVDRSYARLVAINSLITDNTQRDAPLNDDCIGPLEVYGLNLLGDASNCIFTGFYGNSAWRLISPNALGPLQDNGGPTWTHALLPGSNAIDDPATDLGGCLDENGARLTTDQRGAPRIFGQQCDVGAFEFGASVESASQSEIK